MKPNVEGFKSGDKVLCISIKKAYWSFDPEIGKIYTVGKVYPGNSETDFDVTDFTITGSYYLMDFRFEDFTLVKNLTLLTSILYGVEEV